MSIRDEIRERFNNIRECIAQGIHDGDWSAVGWNVSLILAVVMVAVALGVGALALVWKILGTLLDKVFAMPLSLLIIGLLYEIFLVGYARRRGWIAMRQIWKNGPIRCTGMSAIQCTTFFELWREE